MKYQNVTLNHLRTFIVVARLDSFNQAAEELSRSQPAVTLAIKQLEQYIGISLFERTTRQVAATAEAEKFLPVARRLVREFDIAIEHLVAAAECRTGHISVTVLPSVTTRLMPDIIRAFSDKYPRISIQLSDNNARGVQQSVERAEVDFGIASMWMPNSKLAFTPLCEDTFKLVCHRGHKLAQSYDTVSWRQLKHVDFIGSGITQGLSMQRYINSPRFECVTVNSLFAMLKANLGVTALPSLAIPSDPDLVSIPLTAPVETRQICLITRKKSVLSPAAGAMIELLTQETPRLADELCLT